MTGKPFVGRMLSTRETDFMFLCQDSPLPSTGKYSKDNILYKVDRFHICYDMEQCFGKSVAAPKEYSNSTSSWSFLHL